MKENKTLVVIGGGASGLFSGLCAARAGVKTLILERNPRVGKKILATGNGRCNYTHCPLGPEDYFGGDRAFVEDVLKAFPADRAIGFFESIGIEPAPDESGRYFPKSQQAASVLDALRLSFAEAGGETFCDAKAVSVKRETHGFVIQAGEHEIHCECLIMAAGGSSMPSSGSDGNGFSLAKSLGLEVTPLFPALVQLRLDGTAHRAMEGMKWEGACRVLADGKEVSCASGDILFTTYGISGLAVLQASRSAISALSAGAPVAVGLDLFPEWTLPELNGILKKRRGELAHRKCEDFLTGLINKRIGVTALKAVGVALQENAGRLTDEQIEGLAVLMKSWEFKVSGHNGWENSQVTAGGLSLAGFDPRTLESKKVPGLYACGEILDVDGRSGGFNLQWAWASGFVAGNAAADRVKSRK